MNEILNNPALVGLLVGIPSFILGVLAFYRALKSDKAAAQSVFATTQMAAIDQVIKGLNQIIDTLQADNKELRETINDLGVKLKEILEERELLKEEIRKLKTLTS